MNPATWLRKRASVDSAVNEVPLHSVSGELIPVRVKKTRREKKIEPGSVSVGTERALVEHSAFDPLQF